MARTHQQHGEEKGNDPIRNVVGVGVAVVDPRLVEEPTMD